MKTETMSVSLAPLFALCDVFNTVDRYATFQDSRNVYFLHEFIKGGEMFSHLRAAGRFSTDTTRIFAAEVVRPLFCFLLYSLLTDFINRS